jgi:hypothetical protein
MDGKCSMHSSDENFAYRFFSFGSAVRLRTGHGSLSLTVRKKKKKNVVGKRDKERLLQRLMRKWNDNFGL